MNLQYYNYIEVNQKCYLNTETESMNREVELNFYLFCNETVKQ